MRRGTIVQLIFDMVNKTLNLQLCIRLRGCVEVTKDLRVSLQRELTTKSGTKTGRTVYKNSVAFCWEETGDIGRHQGSHAQSALICSFTITLQINQFLFGQDLHCTAKLYLLLDVLVSPRVFLDDLVSTQEQVCKLA
jgi:hypothetical protein